MKDAYPRGVWDNDPSHVANSINGSAPNITGTFGIRAGGDTYNWSGALGYARGAKTAAVNTSGSLEDVQITFNAYNSSSAYERGDNVILGKSVAMYWCIKY